MADSMILQVEKAITGLFEGELTTAKGAPVDLTGKVFRGRARFGANEPLPMLSLLQAPEVKIDDLPAGYGMERKDTVLYVLQGWMDFDPTNPSDGAHLLLAECKRVLASVMDPDSPNYMLRSGNPSNRGMIAGLDISMGLVRPPEQGVSDKAYFWLPLKIEFVENLLDPYALP